MIDKERLSAITLRAMANLFIVFFISRAIFMCWPFDQKYNPRHWFPLVSHLSSFVSLNADLGLFSPHPPTMLEDTKFLIYFSDGTTEEWEFPGDRMLPWDSARSYQQYIRNVLFWNGERSLVKLYQYEARYIAKKVDTAAKHPVRVYFYRAAMIVPPPEVGIGKGLIVAQDFRLFYSYLVKPGDLE